MKAEALATEEKGRALERERMAIDAVKRFGDVIRASPELKNNPSLAPLRASLLREPQASLLACFATGLRRTRRPPRTRSNRLARASSDLGHITNEIGDKREAIRAHEQALAIWQRLVLGAPVDRGFPGLASPGSIESSGS